MTADVIKWNQFVIMAGNDGHDKRGKTIHSLSVDFDRECINVISCLA
jgi:hypothetical protein